MLDYAELSRIDFLPELHEASLAAKADAVQSMYKKCIFAPSGIAYSMPLIVGHHTVRPLSAADLAGTAAYVNGEYSQDGELAATIGNEGCTFENSLCTSGLYLQAQVWRYLVTGDEEARQEARRGFAGIALIYEWNVAAGRPGFLSKPYGQRASQVSTADQYLFALAGLYYYRRIADAAELELIDRIFVDCADFARAHNYRFTFLHSDWYLQTEWQKDLAQLPEETSTMQGDQHAYNAIHMLMQALAWHVSSQSRYRDELNRLSEYGRWQTENYLECWRRQGLQNLLMFERVGLSFFPIAVGEILFEIAPHVFGATESEQAMAWHCAARRWWEFGKIGMNEDLRTNYWVKLDVTTGAWHPTGFHLKKGFLPDSIGDFCSGAYLSNVQESEVTYREGYNSLALALACQDADARKMTQDLLQRADGSRLRWMFDPDGRQLLPPFRYMTALLSSESPGFFLTMYWKGRLNRLWD